MYFVHITIIKKVLEYIYVYMQLYYRAVLHVAIINLGNLKVLSF